MPGCDTVGTPPSPHTHLRSAYVTPTLFAGGTEPKLKWYSELAGPDPAAARAELEEVVAAVVNEWLRPEEYGIKRPAGIPAPPPPAKAV
jgi:hypothetical protein